MPALLDVTSLNNLSSIILDASITVHKEMGPGLLEGVYQHCLIKELRNRQVNVYTNVPVPLHYKGEPLNKEYHRHSGRR
jgi:GxxExxY protein